MRIQLLLVAICSMSLVGCGNVEFVRDHAKPNSAAEAPKPADNEKPVEIGTPDSPKKEEKVRVPDTDGDGIPDPDEIKLGTDPNDPDSDGDGATDGEEANQHGTDPNDPNSNPNGPVVPPSTGTTGDEDKPAQEPKEDQTGTDTPKKDDSTGTPGDGNGPGNSEDDDSSDKDDDKDGLTNDREKQIGTDPQNPDTDGDGLKDGQEVDEVGTNPLDPDTDDGSVGDGDEVAAGTNPVDNPADDVQINCEDKHNISAYIVEGEEFPVKPFVGELSPAANYNYYSFSAHPKIGPKPGKDTLQIYFYRGPKGLTLFFHANKDHDPDNRLKFVNMDIDVKSAGRPEILFGEEILLNVRRKMFGESGQFEVNMRYFKNSDGGVIGYLGNNFDIVVDVHRNSDLDKVILSSNMGENEVESNILARGFKAQNRPLKLRITGKGCEDQPISGSSGTGGDDKEGSKDQDDFSGKEDSADSGKVEQLESPYEKGSVEQIEKSDGKDSVEQVEKSEGKGGVEQVEEPSEKERVEQVEKSDDKDSVEQVEKSEGKGGVEQVEEPSEKERVEQVEKSDDKDSVEQVEKSEDKDSVEQVEKSDDKEAVEQEEKVEDKDGNDLGDKDWK